MPFIPDPDRTLDDIIDDVARELSDRFRDVENQLIREVAERAARDMRLAEQLPTASAGRGLTIAERRRQNRILADLAVHRAVAVRDLTLIAQRAVSRLRRGNLAQRVVEIAAAQGEAAAAAALGFADPVPAGSLRALPTSSQQAVAMVAINLENRLEVLNQRITRYPQDAYQRVTAMYSPSTLLGVTTSRVQQAQAVQRFLSEGIPAFVDRAGKRWTVGAYAEMSGRTSVARAFNDVGVWRMQQSNMQLGTITGGLDACARCAPWIGRIVSFNGATGPVTLPHSTEDRMVTVDVKGTLEQARAAGWGHPNDRCRVVAYSPGLAVPQADFKYDKAAEKERADQRALERKIRAAKRREAAAMNDTDRARAAAYIRDAQADMRAFIRDTGRKRVSYREQLRFADG